KKKNIEAFEKCIKETEKKFSYTDGQKEDFVRTLADNCNKNEISVEEARIAIKEKYNFDDEVVTKIITKEYSNKKSIEDFLNEKYEFRYNEIVDKIEFRTSGSGPYIFVNDYVINARHRAWTKAGYKITSGNLY
ncbi:virulence-associated e family protein, partial [Elizabethkingia anophelis]|nr:virulence-associated e family protein [Elizabethkingia anophelis]